MWGSCRDIGHRSQRMERQMAVGEGRERVEGGRGSGGLVAPSCLLFASSPQREPDR